MSKVKSKKLSMLTTVDNPYNPFTHYDEWNQFDESKGYYTNSFLARICNTSDVLSPIDDEQALEAAIDEILRENVSGLYKRAKESDK